MKDAHLSIEERAKAALERIKTGHGQMRIPVEATDPDMVIVDLVAEVQRLRGINALYERQRDQLAAVLAKVKPEDDPGDPAFYRGAQTGVEPAKPPPVPRGYTDNCAACCEPHVDLLVHAGSGDDGQSTALCPKMDLLIPVKVHT